MESTALARHAARILEKGLGEHISEEIPHLGRAVHALLCLRSTGRGSIPSPGDRMHKKKKTNQGGHPYEASAEY